MKISGTGPADVSGDRRRGVDPHHGGRHARHQSTGGRPAIVLETQGDLILAAPNGRIHQQAMFRSADIGSQTAATSAAKTAAAPLLLSTGKNGPKIFPTTGKHRPCAGQGMDNDESRKGYAQKMKALRKEWPQLTPDQRLGRIRDVVNSENQGPPLTVTPAQMGATSGRFDSRSWSVLINSDELNHPKLSGDEAATLSDTSYHETRHSQQAYLAARSMASDGDTSEAISNKTGLPLEVAQEAKKSPIAANDPQAACAQQMKEAMFGESRSRNNEIESAAAVDQQTLRDLKKKRETNPASVTDQEYSDAVDKANKSYAAYRSLPFEADAFETADPIKHKI